MRYEKALKPILSIGMITIVALLVACGGDGSTTGPEEPGNTDPVSLELSEESVILDRWADTAQIKVTAIDEDGNEVETPSLRWNSSDTSIAEVNSEGLISSWYEGEAEITAETSSGPSLNASLTAEVVIQQNPQCTEPTKFPNQPPVNTQTPMWQKVDNPVDGGQLEIALGMGSVSADFDGNGFQDILVADENLQEEEPGQLLFWRNTGGKFEEVTTEVLGEEEVFTDYSYTNVIADFNGDGILDIYRAQSGYDYPPYPQATNVYLLSQPGGTLKNVSDTHLSTNDKRFTHGAASTDIDCDQDPDLITNNIADGASTFLFVNQGDGQMQNEGEDRLPEKLANGDHPMLSSSNCDIDRDGDDDLVLGSWDNRNMGKKNVLLINDGFGSFRRMDKVLPVSYYEENDVASRMFCRDMNLDGWPDVVALSTDVVTDGSRGVIWVNKGDLEFEVIDLSEEYPGILDIEEVVDINDDSWPDLITPIKDQGIHVLLNRSDFSFDLVEIEFAVDALVDANDDGLMDWMLPGLVDPDNGCCEPPELWVQQ
ncbi:FG-GAP repeat domain-containing protein [Fodinibius halophilus]|uniref:VCBS repeat-containing protein n=1 Tax=Fodinibius halophilus TaxID=1736908 RepID=A0A6M1TCW2_9BACT|nr:VCBS repeat-containing protein [Fodinibius halophilus]NGP90233.1 VCBS repeat-containing protein [Fodinibius halophilus]